MRNGTVLVVDDYRDLNEMLVEYLGTKGYQATGMEKVTSIDQILDINPSVIVLDMELPGLSGGEILRLIRDHHVLSDTPVIVITGDMQRVSRWIYRESQAVLEKPFELDDLTAQMASLM